MNAATGATLEFLDVAHEYGKESGTSFQAIGHLSLDVRQGEMVALIGPSGCGKTTLIRMAAGLIQPTSGEVRVLGKSPQSARQQRVLSIVFQEPALIPWRSTLHNVTLASEVAGLDKPTRELRARELLKQMGLEGFERFAPSKLSGGMKQRTAIARALMLDPRLLLLDEPFGALDQITRERLQSDFSCRWDLADVTVLFVTHNVEEAVFMANRVVVLTPAPCRIAESIEIPEERPRRDEFRASTTFFGLCCAVRDALGRACSEPQPFFTGVSA